MPENDVRRINWLSTRQMHHFTSALYHAGQVLSRWKAAENCFAARPSHYPPGGALVLLAPLAHNGGLPLYAGIWSSP